jgi:hypothetical protein
MNAPARKVVPFTTPQSTIEALMFGLRRGFPCFEDSSNVDRLRRCDEAAMQEIAGRLLNMSERSKGARPDWPREQVDRLIDLWRRLRGKS